MATDPTRSSEPQTPLQNSPELKCQWTELQVELELCHHWKWYLRLIMIHDPFLTDLSSHCFAQPEALLCQGKPEDPHGFPRANMLLLVLQVVVSLVCCIYDDEDQ
jgi:hypothetical protein